LVREYALKHVALPEYAFAFSINLLAGPDQTDIDRGVRPYCWKGNECGSVAVAWIIWPYGNTPSRSQDVRVDLVSDLSWQDIEEGGNHVAVGVLLDGSR
jgi:hypothetical protein